MLKHLAGVAMLALTAPALAAPLDQVYEFTVVTDTLEIGFPLCGNSCTFQEGPVPYKLATLTLTHDALTQHTAVASDGHNDVPQSDDGRIRTFTVEPLPDPPGLPFQLGAFAPTSLDIPESNPACPAGWPDRLFATIPPCSSKVFSFPRFVHTNGYALDLQITGNHLSGMIEIENAQSHGDGCSISMQGHNNNWSGTWRCFVFGAGPLHSFTAISRRVDGQANIVQQ